MQNEFDEIITRLYAEHPEKNKNKLSQATIDFFRGGKIMDKADFEEFIKDILYGSPDDEDIKAYCYVEKSFNDET